VAAIRLDQLSRRYGKTPSEYLRAHWLDHDFDSAVAQIAGWYENEVEHFDESKEVKKKRKAREHHAEKTLQRLRRAARNVLGDGETEVDEYSDLDAFGAALGATPGMVIAKE
jgi:hypothetical protein